MRQGAKGWAAPCTLRRAGQKVEEPFGEGGSSPRQATKISVSGSNKEFKSMGGTTSKESPPGGSESRGGVQHVTTNTPAAESDLGKQDSTSTSKKMNAAARGHPATASETRQDLAGAGFLTAGATWLRDNTVGTLAWDLLAGSGIWDLWDLGSVARRSAKFLGNYGRPAPATQIWSNVP